MSGQTPHLAEIAEDRLTAIRERLDHHQRWAILERESDVRCVSCDLRYAERQQYGCVAGRGHHYDEGELAEARAPQPDDADQDLGELLAEVRRLRLDLACVLEATYWDRPYDTRIAAIRDVCQEVPRV